MEGARLATADDVARLGELCLQAQEELLASRGAGLLFSRKARRDPVEQLPTGERLGARAIKNFFEESGFTARLLVMHRCLNGDG